MRKHIKRTTENFALFVTGIQLGSLDQRSAPVVERLVLIRLDGERLFVFLPRRFEQPIGLLAGFGRCLFAERSAPVGERLVLIRLDGERLLEFLPRRFEQPIGLSLLFISSGPPMDPSPPAATRFSPRRG